MREISKNLSYEDKHRISIPHRSFDFRSTCEFKLVDTYASLTSDWEVFRKDLHLTLDTNIVCCEPLKKVILNVINYVGCKSVMGHLLFCNRLFEGEKQCTYCTRMICFNHTYSRILSRVNLTKSSTLMMYASDRMREAFLTIIPQKTDSVLFFKSFISSTPINTPRIKNNQKNFYDINPMSANHPLLIFTNLLEISSRITINYLYESITKLSKDISFPSYMPIDLKFIELIVGVVQIVCFHYLQHFSYEGFCLYV